MEKLKLHQTIGLIYQVIIAIALLFSYLYYYIDGGFEVIAKILLILLFLGLAYNNHVTFKRKYFTLVYLAVAILAGVIIFI